MSRWRAPARCGDVRRTDILHVVPEGLAGELIGGGGQQARQDGAVVPMGQLGLASRVAARLMAAKSRYWPTRGPGHAWDLGVDELDQADLPGLVKEGGDIAEASQADGLGRG